MGLVVKDDGWRISDALRNIIEPMLPIPKDTYPWGCHNPRVDNRDAMNGIIFVLRTGSSGLHCGEQVSALPVHPTDAS